MKNSRSSVEQVSAWDHLSPLARLVLDAYPELISLQGQEIQQGVLAVYQHNRTLQQALDALSRPQPTPHFTSSMLMPLVILIEALLDQLGKLSAGLGLSHFLVAERQLWVENYELSRAIKDRESEDR